VVPYFSWYLVQNNSQQTFQRSRCFNEAAVGVREEDLEMKKNWRASQQ
jgi:hypothetical protein